VSAWNELLNKEVVPADELRAEARDDDTVRLSGSYIARIPEGRRHMGRGTFDDTFHATLTVERAQGVIEDFLRRWPHV
jgi:hypothetical protein